MQLCKHLRACSSASIYAPPTLGLWWNFTSEPYGPRYARYFPTQVFYTDRTNDLSLSAAAQLALAKNILVGPMQTTFMTLSTTQMIAIIQSVKQTLNDDLEDKLSSAQGLAVGGIIISFVGVAITVLIVVLRLFDLVDSSNMSRIGGGGEGSGGAGAGEAAAGTGSAGGGSGGSGGGGAQRQDELFLFEWFVRV
ncbi:transmembrane protein, putative [Bodo saltans]|uniref:Transmembrane protein, putative n=1 Tax=Bodo saltans TaxID=75058 RepID=A0A0S4IYS8_BODSA|nr:transmembrane protein, putative [Bodo saltans]|eukprot:CUG17512.1 transmembrane protein, putative [Bodo saltans]